MPLNPFKKSPLDAAHSTRTKQAELLEEAKLALADRIATVDQLGDGCADAETLRKAISAKTAAQQERDARAQALNKTELKIAELKAEESRQANIKRCNEAADKLEDTIDRPFAKDMNDLGLVLGRCVVSAGRVRENIPHDGGLVDLFAKLLTEIPVSVKMNRSELKFRVAAVRAGQAVVAEPAPAPIPLPKPAPVVQVCVLKEGVAWLDSQGVVQIAGRGADIDLPPKTAQRAIEIGPCVGVSDPRRRKLKEGYGIKVGRPLFRNCVQLSDGMVDPDREPFADPIVRSVPPATIDPRFTPIDRGPGFQMQVARNNLDGIATRNKGEDDK